MKSPTLLRLALLALFASLCPAWVQAETSLKMKSDPGDWIGGGKTYSFSESAGTFTVTKNYYNGVSVAFVAPGYTQYWSLAFAAPGRVLLQAGAFPGATRFPFNDVGEAGLDVSGNSRGSNQLTGAFVVKDIAFGPNDIVERFWAVFEQHSEGGPAALKGEIRYKVDVVTQVSAPIEQTVDFDHDLDFAVTATDTGGRVVTLSAANLPPGATFTDHHNNTGTLHWRPSLSQSGVRVPITFSADKGAGGIDATTTVIDVRGITRLTMTSGPDDPVGGGSTYDLGPVDGRFSAYAPDYPRDAGGIIVNFNKPDYSAFWSLTFVPPAGETLATGVYTGSGWNPARMDVTNTYSYANAKLGNFQVKELVIEAGKVRKFWATFEQTTAGATAPLRGEIKFNVSSNFDLTAPIHGAVAAGGTVDTAVAATGGSGSVTLSATDLPAGATFTDHGDSTGTLHWPTTAANIGVQRVSFRAQDGGGQVRTTLTAIDVKGVTALAIRQSPSNSDPAERIYDYTEAAGVFRLTKNTGAGVSVTFSPNNGDYTQAWSLDFAAPAQAKLTPGFYRGAVGNLPSDSAPTLLVRAQSQYPSGLLGIFEVKEIAYGPDDTLTRFRATFAQDAIGTPRLQGEIRFNAKGGPAISAPLQQVKTFGGTIDFDVTASDSTGGTPVLSAANLPHGASFIDRGDGTGHFHWVTTVSDRGSRDVIFKAQNSAGASDTGTTAIEVTGVMALAVNSQQGDFVGGGQDYNLRAADGRFTVRKNENAGVTVSFQSDDPSKSWTMSFSAPGNAPLTAGSYSGAVGYFSPNSSAPAMLVTRDGYSYFSTIMGSFVIKEIVLRPDGTIESFWATFEQHADGHAAGLAGEIKFNVAAPVQLSAPALVTLSYGSVLDLPVSALSTSAGNITLTASPLPQGAVFTDHGNGTGNLYWQPSFAGIGNHTVIFTARNAEGKTDTATTKIEVAGMTSLTMKSDPDDFVGAGYDYDYTQADGRFTAVTSGPNGIFVSFTGNTVSWNLNFAVPIGAVFAPGIYSGARADYPGSSPRLYVSGNGRGPSGQTGAFRIRQIVFGPGDTVESLWAVFEQHDGDGDPALVGEIKFNATAAEGVTISAPFQTRVRYQETLEFDVTASSSAGGSLELSVADAPPNALFTDHGDGTGTFRWTPGIADRGKRDVTFIAKNAAGATDSTITSIETRGLTSLSMVSDEGDFVGGGESYFFPADAGQFDVAPNYDNGVTVNFHNKGYKEYWSLNFAAPGDARLQPGTYAGATRYPFQAADAPGLSVFGDSRGSNMLTGNFTVKQIAYAADGSIESFWVLFEQHSEGAAPALFGEFKYNAWPAGQISAPLTRSIKRGQTIEFDISAVAPNNAPLTLSAASLPSGAVFTDHHDNTGTFRWPTGTTQRGRYEVTFTAANASGPVDSTKTSIDVRGVTSLALQSEPGDFIGQGKDTYFPETAGSFILEKNYANGVALRFAGGSSSWSLNFCAPQSVPLRPGTYLGATRFPFQATTEPGLDVSGDGRGSNTLTGRFTVKEIVYGPDNSILSFWATFEQHSDGAGPALRGEVKYNADAPDEPEIPGTTVFEWSEVKGAFRGVTGDSHATFPSATGPITLKISPTGAVTGNLRLGRITYYFRGALADNGTATLTARSPGGRTVTVKLRVTGGDGRYQVTGQVLDADGNSTAFTAGRVQPFHTQDEMAGHYTFVLRPTGGALIEESGWGSIFIGKTGALRMFGTTADGRTFATSALPHEGNSWPIFLPTFALRGSISGLITAADLATSDLSGAIRWIRPATASGPYRSATTAELFLEAARFTPSLPALQLPAGFARMTVTGAGQTAFEETVMLNDRTPDVTILGGNPARLLLFASGRTGYISGRFLNAAHRTTTLRGVIFQKTNLGYGSFSDGIELGIFTLEPQ